MKKFFKQFILLSEELLTQAEDLKEMHPTSTIVYRSSGSRQKGILNTDSYGFPLSIFTKVRITVISQ